MLASFLAASGISHLKTPPHTPEYNGISEGCHRYIVETGLALLTHASMPASYWTYAFATATYLINRMSTKTLSMASPFSSLFSASPNYLKLRVFGCLCYPWLRPYTSNKLEPHSLPCIFLGYSLTQSAYLCLDITTSSLYISRHVHFCESLFPFSKPFVSSPSQSDESEPAWVPTVTPLEHDNRPLTMNSSQPALPLSIAPSSDTSNSPTNTAPSLSPEIAAAPTPEYVSTAPSMLGAQPPPINHHQMITRAKNQIQKLNSKYNYVANLVLLGLDPHTISQALADP